jgi:hypothetical protein
MYRLLSIGIYPALIAVNLAGFVLQVVLYFHERRIESIFHAGINLFTLIAFFVLMLNIDASAAYAASLNYAAILCWLVVLIFSSILLIMRWVEIYDQSRKAKL